MQKWRSWWWRSSGRARNRRSTRRRCSTVSSTPPKRCRRMWVEGNLLKTIFMAKASPKAVAHSQSPFVRRLMSFHCRLRKRFPVATTTARCTLSAKSTPSSTERESGRRVHSRKLYGAFAVWCCHFFFFFFFGNAAFSSYRMCYFKKWDLKYPGSMKNLPIFQWHMW